MFILKRKYRVSNFVKYKHWIMNHLIRFFSYSLFVIRIFFQYDEEKMAEWRVIKITQRNMDLYVNSEHSDEKE